jgi:putative chitinase
MQLITSQQLSKIAPALSPERSALLSDLLNELCSKYGITDKGVFQMFLANVVQESGEFSAKEENMNYRAQTLANTWPGRFSSTKSKPYIPNSLAFEYERQSVKLANFVYGGRMGNIHFNDGNQFKGGGFIGLTGREVYTKYAQHIGKDVTLTSDLIRTQDRYALDSACWFFANLKNLIPVALKGNWIGVVKGINGGLIGLDKREMYYERVKEVIT